jgi:hypothetical protein
MDKDLERTSTIEETKAHIRLPKENMKEKIKMTGKTTVRRIRRNNNVKGKCITVLFN